MTAGVPSQRASIGCLVLALAVPALGSEPPDAPFPVRASGSVEALVTGRTDDAPRQRPQALFEFHVDGALRPGLRAHLDLRGLIGGPFDPSHDDFEPHVYNFVHTFQQHSPAMEVPEAWIDATLGRLDARIGIQRFAWGKLDGVAPTDVLSPRDFHDPFVTDVDDARIGIPAVQLGYEAPDIPSIGMSHLRATLIGIPLAVPSRLPFPRERWFPSSLVPTSIHVGGQLLERLIQKRIKRLCKRKMVTNSALCPDGDVTVAEAVDQTPSVQTANQRPRLRLDAGGIGVRLSAALGGMDWSIYHYTGPETGPDLELDTALTLKGPVVDGDDPQTLHLDKLQTMLTLRQMRSKIHMTGFDWSTSVGDATIRGEAAFFEDRPYLRLGSDLVSDESLQHLKFTGGLVKQGVNTNCVDKPCRGGADVAPLFPQLDSVEWGTGVDYVLRDTFLLVQLNQIVIHERAPRLVISNPETRFTTVVQRSFLGNRLDLELRGVIAADRGAWFVFPRVAYHVTDDLRARVGYLAIGGTRNSLIGQFKENDEVVVDLRWTF